MISYIAKMLGYKVIHTTKILPLLLSKRQISDIKWELQSLLLDMDGVGAPYGSVWSHEWMCCTTQAYEITKIAKQYPILRELNRSWLATRPYTNQDKVVFPIQSVLAAENVYGYYEEERRVELRKELFDHWCKQLIGEYIREDSKVLN